MQKPQTDNAIQQPTINKDVVTGNTLNPIAVKRIWGKQVVIPAELFQTVTQFPDKKITANTHWVSEYADKIKLIPYDDNLGMAQTEIAKDLKCGEIAISIKHHSPCPESELSEHIKLQCTHVQFAVGIKDGVITVNNPQPYQNGLFGEPDYPMIFVKPKFPSGVSDQEITAYTQNIRTWLVIANTFSTFPGDYNGSDPLTCIDKDKILKMGKALLGALQSNPTDIAWLQKPEQQLYCAELAFLALNLGLHFPLNKQNVGSNFEKIKQIIDTKGFLQQNENSYVKEIDISIAAENLKPIDSLVDIHNEGKFWGGLALTPFCVADMIEQYIQRVIPRHELGEVDGSKYQSVVFEKIKPMLKEFLVIEGTEAEADFDAAVIEVSKIVARPHTTYDAFRAALHPVFNKLENLSLKYGYAYIPPHCFMVRASDYIIKQKQGGVLGWEYMGHGIHSSMLKGAN